MIDVRPMKNESLNWLHHVFATELTSKAKMVACVINSYMYDDDGEAYPSLARISHEASLSKRSVQNGIDELSKAGWLIKKPGGKSATGVLFPNRYRRKWPEGLQKTLTSGDSTNVVPLDKHIAGGAIHIAGGATPIAGDAIPIAGGARGIAPVANEIEKEIEIEKSSARTPAKRFVEPTQGEVMDYMISRDCTQEQAASWAEDFCDYYASNGWKVGRNKMKSWPHAAAKWAKQNLERNHATRQSASNTVHEGSIQAWRETLS